MTTDEASLDADASTEEGLPDELACPVLMDVTAREDAAWLDREVTPELLRVAADEELSVKIVWLRLVEGSELVVPVCC